MSEIENHKLTPRRQLHPSAHGSTLLCGIVVPVPEHRLASFVQLTAPIQFHVLTTVMIS